MSGLIFEDKIVECFEKHSDSLAISLIKNCIKHAALNGNKLVISVPNVFYRGLINKSLTEGIIKELGAYSIHSVSVNVDTSINYGIKSKSKSEVSVMADISRDVGRVPIDPLKPLTTFVVGKSNRLAYLAAKYMCEGNETLLYIHGGSGCGKTHLLQALGNDAIQNNKRVYYLPSEQFISEYVTSVRDKSVNQFRNNLQNTDILLFDDFDLVSKRQSFLNEFSYLLNRFILLKKQIVIVSQKHPSTYYMDSRLKTRLCSGLLIKILQPTIELKRTCVRMELDSGRVQYDDSIIEKISRVFSTIGELLAAVRKVTIFAKMMERNVTQELLEEVLQIDQVDSDPQVKKIVLVLSKVFSIGQDDILSRKKSGSHYRHILCYYLRKRYGMSTREIAEKIGILTHSTVLYAVRKIEIELAVNNAFRKELALIEQELDLQS